MEKESSNIDDKGDTKCSFIEIWVVFMVLFIIGSVVGSVMYYKSLEDEKYYSQPVLDMSSQLNGDKPLSIKSLSYHTNEDVIKISIYNQNDLILQDMGCELFHIKNESSLELAHRSMITFAVDLYCVQKNCYSFENCNGGDYYGPGRVNIIYNGTISDQIIIPYGITYSNIVLIPEKPKTFIRSNCALYLKTGYAKRDKYDQCQYEKSYLEYIKFRF